MNVRKFRGNQDEISKFVINNISSRNLKKGADDIYRYVVCTDFFREIKGMKQTTAEKRWIELKNLYHMETGREACQIVKGKGNIVDWHIEPSFIVWLIEQRKAYREKQKSEKSDIDDLMRGIQDAFYSGI